jgi:hypothetical protein
MHRRARRGRDILDPMGQAASGFGGSDEKRPWQIEGTIVEAFSRSPDECAF